MKIQIYVAGEGQAVGRWLSLPMREDGLKQVLEEIADGKRACEIRDFEAPFIIEKYDDVFTINEAVAVMAEYDHRLVFALCGCTNNVEQVIRILNSGQYKVCYDVESLHDVADALMWSGYYGRVPVSLKRYIDYDKVVRELENAGWHFQPEVHVAVMPLS